MVEKGCKTLDQNGEIETVLIDLSKAFYCIDLNA